MMEPGMRITYDPMVDALAVELAPKARSIRTQALSGDINLDWDAQGRLITIEILSASSYYPRAELEQLAGGGVKMLLAQAAELSGLGADTLRVMINQGTVPGEKRGRDWYVNYADILNYLARRKPVGRPPKLVVNVTRPQSQPRTVRSIVGGKLGNQVVSIGAGATGRFEDSSNTDPEGMEEGNVNRLVGRERTKTGRTAPQKGKKAPSKAKRR